MPAREMLLHLACVFSGLGAALAGALLFTTGHAAHAVAGGILFALGAAGVALQPPYSRGARTPSPRNRGRAILRVGRVCFGSALHWWPRLFRVFPVCNPEPGSVIGPIIGDPDPRILPAIAWFPLVTLTCD